MHTRSWITVALGVAVLVPVSLTAHSNGGATSRTPAIFVQHRLQTSVEVTPPVSEPGMVEARQAAPAPVSREAQQRAARKLSEATRAVTRPVGPGDVCLAQMKTVFCPVIAQIPVLRDIVGQMAIWGNFDCPTTAAGTTSWFPRTALPPPVRR